MFKLNFNFLKTIINKDWGVFKTDRGVKGFGSSGENPLQLKNKKIMCVILN